VFAGVAAGGVEGSHGRVDLEVADAFYAGLAEDRDCEGVGVVVVDSKARLVALGAAMP
jgi:hypothetical protein